MAYEKGSYLRELKVEHEDGRHDEERFSLCPVCIRLDDEEYARELGFASDDEYKKFVSDQCNEPAPELEAAVDELFAEEHRQGQHRKYPSRYCPVCTKEHGFSNI